MSRESSCEGLGRTPSAETRRPSQVAEVLWRATERLSRAGVENARLDAEWLLMAALGWDKEAVYRNFRCQLEDEEQSAFDRFVARRCTGEPAAYITGEREFWSLGMNVNRDVLIPRPETEHLVDTVLIFLTAWTQPIRILELGTGSGAVAISLAHEMPDIEVWATDLSVKALRVAQANARQHGLAERIQFLAGDLFEALGPRPGSFTAIMSNPPYIPSGALASLPQGIRDWEPPSALDGGVDGMDFYRRIISAAPGYLCPQGLLALEVGSHMAGDVGELFRLGNGFNPATVVHDLAGYERVVWATVC